MKLRLVLGGFFSTKFTSIFLTCFVGDSVGGEDGCGVIGDRVISSGSVGGIEG